MSKRGTIALHCSSAATRNSMRPSNKFASPEKRTDEDDHKDTEHNERIDFADNLFSSVTLWRKVCPTLLHQLRNGESYETNHTDPALSHVGGHPISRAGEAENGRPGETRNAKGRGAEDRRKSRPTADC